MNKEIKEITIASLILSANRALIGEIRQKMREVSICYNKDKQAISLYIYYDEPLTADEEDYDISGNILTEIISSYPQAAELIWEEHEIVLPYPNRIPDQGICIFRRYEPDPDI
jgi:hypothetical protein